MTRGLLIKTIREVWLWTLLMAVGLFAVQMLFASLLPQFGKEMLDQLLKFEYIQRMFSALLNMEVDQAAGPQALSAIVWVHPIVFALVWAHAIVFCTRVPAGEIDRGTIDVLLSLPISRLRLLASESMVWISCGATLVALNGVGRWLGLAAFAEERLTTLEHIVFVSVNLLALYLSVGGIAWLASSMCNGRGRAVALSFGVVVAALLLNSLAAFNATVQRFAFLSILKYYRPMEILRDSQFPTGDIVVLLLVALAAWIGAAIIFARRDIHTV